MNVEGHHVSLLTNDIDTGIEFYRNNLLIPRPLGHPYGQMIG